MVKRHVILRKRPVHVEVDLPNGRSFTSRWERISRRQLPINIRVARDRKIGPRKNNYYYYYYFYYYYLFI